MLPWCENRSLRISAPRLRAYDTMLINGRNWKSHLPAIAVALVLLAVLALFYISSAISPLSSGLPSGSSTVGIVTGSVAGVIFLFLFAYWPRRWKGTRGCYQLRWIGSAESWLRYHIWLGLITLPLVLMHSGFSFGKAPFNFTFMVLFLVVYASGIVGLILQNIIPRLLLTDCPDETIYSQIEQVLGQLVDDAEHKLAVVSGGAFVEEKVRLARLKKRQPEDDVIYVGSERKVGTVRQRITRFTETNIEVTNIEALERAWREEIRPYLTSFRGNFPRLEYPVRATEYFNELKRRTGPGGQEVVAFIEAACTRRRQLGRQRTLHYWLHSWLWLHLPLSIALMVLLAMHVFKTLQYSVNPWVMP